jgi:uncharacterized repeat protein (TIGR02543 family)
MKKNWFLFPVILLVLAGMVIGCDDGGGGGGGGNTTTVTITFNPNGGTFADNSTGNKTVQINKGGTLAATQVPANPTKDGYDFGGWFFGDVALNLSTTYDVPRTYTAKWDVAIVIVPPEDFDAVYLGNFNMSGTGDNTEKQKGWVSNGYDGIASEHEVWEFLEAEYLWIWVKNKPAGGMQLVWQGDGENVDKGGWFSADILANDGSVATAFSDCVELEADQDGWVIKITLADALGTTSGAISTSYTDATAGFKLILAYYTGTGLSALGTMKAYLLLPEDTIEGWEKVTVTFDSDEGSAVADVVVVKGYPMGNYYPEDPEKEGNIFDGWVDEDDNVYTMYTPIDDNVELTAVWVVPITVTWVYGDDDSKEDTIGKGQKLSTINIPSPPKNDDGMIFAGWYTDPEYEDGSELDPDAEIDEDITFYAKWLSPVTITFDLDDGGFGNVLDDIEIPEGYTMKQFGVYPDNPRKPGFTFAGWKDDASNTVDGDTEIDDDIDLTAQWTPVAPFTTEAGAFSWKGNANENGWSFGGFQTADDEDLDTFFHALYLVIETEGGGAGTDTKNDGFGGFGIVLQGNPSWGWGDTGYGDWLTFAHESDDDGNLDTVYFVIDLTALNDYDKVIKDKSLGLRLSMWPWDGLGFKKAYFTNEDLSTKPAGAAEMKKGGTGDAYGYVTLDDPFGP